MKIDRLLRKVLVDLVKGRARWPLFLHGKPGRGKTWAAKAFCEIVPGSEYLTMEDSVQLHLKSADKTGMLRLIRSPLVVLDELAVRSTQGDLEYVALKRIADVREHKPAIYVSNLNPRDMQRVYDERIFSRICCGTWFELKGSDRRMEP